MVKLLGVYRKYSKEGLTMYNLRKLKAKLINKKGIDHFQYWNTTVVCDVHKSDIADYFDKKYSKDVNVIRVGLLDSKETALIKMSEVKAEAERRFKVCLDNSVSNIWDLEETPTRIVIIVERYFDEMRDIISTINTCGKGIGMTVMLFRFYDDYCTNNDILLSTWATAFIGPLEVMENFDYEETERIEVPKNKIYLVTPEENTMI